jgi:DNA-binding Lrp family transcriptional regulator
LGFIQYYGAILNHEKIGYDLLCFVHVSLMAHQAAQVQGFRAAALQMPEVMECHHITGEYDYLLKVLIRNHADLERFVVMKLTPLPGVARIHTSLVLSEVKSSTVMPIPE